MSKSKLEKFAEIDRLTNVLQYPFETLRREGMTFPHKGHWSDEVFRNGNPIILELGCGRGEYTVELCTDDDKYGGFHQVEHIPYPTKRFDGKDYVELYLPARTAVVLKEHVVLPKEEKK